MARKKISKVNATLQLNGEKTELDTTATVTDMAPNMTVTPTTTEPVVEEVENIEEQAIIPEETNACTCEGKCEECNNEVPQEININLSNMIYDVRRAVINCASLDLGALRLKNDLYSILDKYEGKE